MLTQNFYPEIGSAANRLQNIAALLSEDNQVHVLTSAPTYPNQEIYQQNKFWDEAPANVTRVTIRTQYYTSNLFFRLLLYLETIIKLTCRIIASKDKYDIVFISTPPIFISIPGIIAKWKWKARLIVDVRDLWPDALRGMGKKINRFHMKVAYSLENKVYQAADEILINSEGFLSYLQEKEIEPAKISFVPNGLTQQELSQTTKTQREKITVIYAGNIGLAQNLDVFCELAKAMVQDRDIKFKIVGYGYKKTQLEQRILAENLSRNTTILPPDTRKNVLEMIRESDIAFLSLTDHQVFDKVIPGKLIDYMGCAIPIVAVVSGYSKAVIEKAHCGFVFQQKELKAIIASITLLKNSPQLRQDLGNNGWRFAMNNYNWELNKQKLKEVCQGE